MRVCTETISTTFVDGNSSKYRRGGVLVQCVGADGLALRLESASKDQIKDRSHAAVTGRAGVFFTFFLTVNAQRSSLRIHRRISQCLCLPLVYHILHRFWAPGTWSHLTPMYILQQPTRWCSLSLSAHMFILWNRHLCFLLVPLLTSVSYPLGVASFVGLWMSLYPTVCHVTSRSSRRIFVPVKDIRSHLLSLFYLTIPQQHPRKDLATMVFPA